MKVNFYSLNNKVLKKKGVLLVNLGSPDSTKFRDVRKYLGEFLMDKRVIDMPYLKRLLLVKGIILNTRPKKTAAAYKKIWLKEGSPLIILSEKFHKKVSKKSKIPVALSMRYGSMSIENGITELNNQGVNHIFLIPLYPHYAMSSFETVVEKVFEIQKKSFPDIKIDTFPAFYRESNYIKAMSGKILKNIKDFKYDYILFSYHGIPERHIKISDPTKTHCKIDGTCCDLPSKAHQTCYRHQCFETTRGIVKTLGLKEGTYGNSFQSRLLKDPWLKPYTDFEFERLAKEGVKNLIVLTPSFVTDCLETLEEIAIEGKNQFLEAGGISYKHIPCLNDDDQWVEVVYNWIKKWEDAVSVSRKGDNFNLETNNNFN